MTAYNDPVPDFRRVLRETLVADVGIAAATGGRVYDAPPQGVAAPWVQIGESISLPEDTECGWVTTTTLDIHVWTRVNGKHAASQLAGQVVSAVTGSLPGRVVDHPNLAMVALRIEAVRVFTDPNEVDNHAVVSLTADLQRGA